MKRVNLIPFLVLALSILAAWVGYHFYQPNQNLSSTSDRVYSGDVQIAPSTDQTSSLSENEDNIYVSDEDKEEREAEPELDRSLVYTGWNLASDRDVLTACFNFNTKLNPNSRVIAQDYIEVTPDTGMAIEIAGQQLCLSGFEHDTDYDVMLRQGFVDAEGRVLGQDISEVISFGDKPPYVGFKGDGIILPRIKGEGLAIETVNVDRLDVKVFRVNDRMLARRTPQVGRATLEGNYGWEYEDAAVNIRETIWTGEFDVDNRHNQSVSTLVPMGKLIKGLSPGAYIVTAQRASESDEQKVARAWRWIISTDLALTSYWGQDGLTVGVRSIDNARLQSGIRVALVANNNDILAEERTDATGHVHFPSSFLNGQGAKQARMLMAYGPEQDYAVLDLQRAPLDLSQYDIDGRISERVADIYAYGERGVYRPGETAHFTIVLRDSQGRAQTERPVILKVKRPNGMTMLTHKISSEELKSYAGVITWAYDVPKSASRGRWTLEVEAEGVKRIKKIGFSVEDFVPQKLKLDIDVAAEPMGKDEAREVILDAQFLYGAPGAALSGEAEARVRIDPKPFKRWEAYKFGPSNERFEEQLVRLGRGVTDGRGFLSLNFDISEDNIDSPHPLRAIITAGVEEPGGRYVKTSEFVPIRTQATYIGIKPSFEGRRASKDRPVEFSMIAVDASGQRQESHIEWRLIEEDWDYHWYRERNRWHYRRDVRDLDIESGQADLVEDRDYLWSQKLDWGDYRLELTSADGAKSSYRFSVGWAQASRADMPDQIRVGVPNQPLKINDNIKLAINTPYAGEAELVIANDKIQMMRPLKLAEGSSELNFRFDPKWGDSVYALLTLYTPRDTDSRPIPRRAVGIGYISLDRTSQTLDIDLDVPDLTRPRQTLAVNIKLDNIPRGETAYVNLAAVDEGILRLTKYQTPDAPEYFFGKKALSIDIWDDYGRILNPNQGQAAIARSGGDSLGGEGLTVVPTRTVSLFHGPVKIRGGTAKIDLDIPDFNGELRLMATGWSESSVGSSSTAVTVRDKVPAIVGLPRFMAPGDRAQMNVSLDNVEGKAGLYEVKVAAQNLISVTGDLEFNLKEGQRLDQHIDIKASEIGIDELDVRISGPEAYSVTSDYPLQIRSPYLPMTRTVMKEIRPGESISVSSEDFEGFVAETSGATISFSRLPGLDPAPYLESLRHYPYQCTEQTTSSSLGLLYAEELGGIPNQSQAERQDSLRRAVLRLSSRQSRDGAFGLWSEGDGYASPWIGIYATDFLLRAREQNIYVAEDVMEAALKAAGYISRMPRYPNIKYKFPNDREDAEHVKADAAAYAHYVLAKAGRGNIGQMRYFFDNHKSSLATPLAYAHIGGALALMGDKPRSRRAFDLARNNLGKDIRYDYYQSPLRDVAGIVAIIAEIAPVETDNSGQLSYFVENFQKDILDKNYLNTQQKAFTLLALNALQGSSDTMSISSNQVDIMGRSTRPQAWVAGSKVLDEPVNFISEDKDSFWATISVYGAPSSAPAPVSEGLSLTKSYFSLEGKPMDVSQVKQGERMIVKLGFNSQINRSRTIILADLLPAGFEIETILTPKDGQNYRDTNGIYHWLGAVASFEVAEARDDRFIASLETDRRSDYVAAYIVRAVTPGDFAHPGAVIEDMYRAGDRAITASSRIQIIADPSL